MGKRKDTTAKGVKPSKTLSSVKSGSVVKLSQTPKSKSKEIAKKAATVFDKDAEKSKAAHDNDSKKKKKKAKEPTPPPETSESEEGSDSETDESVAKGPKKGRAAPATNGKLTSKKADADTSSSSSSSSDDESDEESEPEKPVKPVAKKAASIAASLKTQTASTKGAPPVAAPKDVPMSSDDDDSSTGDDEGSESESESVSEDDEDEKAAPKQKQAPVAKAPAANGTAKKGVAPQISSDEEDSDDGSDEGSLSASSDDEDDEDDEDSDGSDGSSEDDEAPKTKAPVSKKRAPEDDSAAPAKKLKADAAAQNGDGPKTLFVGSLSWNVDEEWLRREFESFGDLAGTRVISDRNTGKSRGFGYVEFTNAADAAAALKAMTGAEIDGRPVNIDLSTGRATGSDRADRPSDRAKSYGDSNNPPSDTLYVANVAFGANEDTLSEAFAQYGTINGVRLPTDPDTGNLRGFGYVQFGSIEEASEALKNMNGESIAGRPVRLDYSTPRQNSGGSPRRGGDRGGFNDRGGRGGGRGGRGGDRGGRGGRGGGRGGGGFGRGNTTNRGGFGDFRGQKKSFG